ncbi:ClpXP protease specificity-enhancing factor [Caldichromatium japonicum]|uniref:ClpXP protease specificity-enhancing factor n=1 Tax=Caldichromatium japonicum TaxID=2699430 RepID=A0A6G7VB78_9GAMM|nr:ClpXP protease specificity-enhancing factor [Caldichromatium japonicum]QIK37047.1 ClpXP protease specificity-enhancing factor [Caldichromatium japonicum]
MSVMTQDRMTSSKPYLIRAIYEWILDNQMTPHLLVDVHFPQTRVPLEFATDGRIVLNIAPSAVRGLVIGNEWIEFSARFGGVARDVLIPTEAVIGIFTRENNQGMFFPEPEYPAVSAQSSTGTAPRLTSLSGGQAADDKPSPNRPKGKTPAGKTPTLKVVK